MFNVALIRVQLAQLAVSIRVAGPDGRQVWTQDRPPTTERLGSWDPVPAAGRFPPPFIITTRPGRPPASRSCARAQISWENTVQ